jgi:hypothetical protein
MMLVRVCLCSMFVLLGAIGESSGADSKPASGSLKEWRRPAVERKRRIIFDNDGNEPLVTIKRPDAQDFLDARTSALAGSQVDTIFYGTNACFGTASRASEAWSVFSVRAEPHIHNQTAQMIAAGLDPLKLMIEFGRRNRMEVFSAIRMNDVHDKDNAGYPLVRWANNPFKNQHPDLLLGTREQRPKHGGWSAVSFDSPVVRDSMFAFASEAIRNYDIDGLHLDFFRHPVFFRSTAKGEPATTEELGMMTELISRIRRLADETGKSRGRPILVSVRVPDSVEYCRAIGLDIERWLKADLIDLLCGSSYFQLQEWKSLAELGHRYGVPVYPSLDESRVKDEHAKSLRMSAESYRGRAANVWQSGADGVLLFNAFDPASHMWRELGEPAVIQSLDRDYVASVRGVVGANGGNLPFQGFQKTETLNPAQPKVVKANEPATARLMVGESVRVTRPKTMALALRFDRLRAPSDVLVSLDGEELTGGKLVDDVLSFAPSFQQVRAGENSVAVRLREGGDAVKWIDLVLQVRVK